MYIWISRSRSELPLRMCVYKETPANGIHIDDDDVSKKISSNRPVMESNWQKGKFIEHSLSDELVRAFMKCWSLGYLKISTQSSAPIVRVGIWALWWSDGSFSTVFRHDRVHTIYAQFCSACEHWTPATVFIISFRKHACREFNVPLYVYTILAKHFRLQILSTEADQTQTHTHIRTHTQKHGVLLLLLFPLHYVLLLLTRLKYWFLLDRPRHLQPLVFLLPSLCFPSTLPIVSTGVDCLWRRTEGKSSRQMSERLLTHAE